MCVPIRVLLTMLALVSCARAVAQTSPPETPLFSFGMISDVQYQDKDPFHNRHYRTSLRKLRESVADLNTRALRFTIQLGDLIDEGEQSLGEILPVFNGLNMERRHVLGNHDFALGRTTVLEALGLESAYYTFAHEGWRFVVLDSVDVSVSGGWPEDSERVRLARTMLAALESRKQLHGYPWNGALGKAQLAWLDRTLADACARGERVVVAAHHPVLLEATTPYHLMWNHEEVRAVLDDHACVVAYLNGHDHGGGYAERGGIHYLSVNGMVEAPERNAYAVVHVFDDRLQVEGTGKQPSRTLEVRPRQR